jgi:hypothetical protein
MCRSNAELVLCHFRKLLEDGQEHPMGEIVEYVLGQTDGMDIYGESLTTSMIYSSIAYKLNKDSEFVRLQRGIYRMNIPVTEGNTAFGSAHSNVQMVLARAIRDIEDCFVIDLITIGDGELERLQELKSTVLGRLSEIKEEVSSLRDNNSDRREGEDHEKDHL